ncbi:AEC family transporter [Metabacillus sp. HB246100]
MESFNLQFLYCIMIIAIGYGLKRSNFIKEKDGEGLSRLLFNLTLPCLLIVTFNGITIQSSLFVLIIAGFVYGLIIASVGFLFFRKSPRKIKGMVRMMLPGLNIGLFAYPLVEVIFGHEGITYFAMFDVGNAFIIFGLSYFIASFYSEVEEVKLEAKTILVKMSKSVPLMTYLLVLILSIIGIRLPQPIIDVSEIISKANMPLSLLLLGIFLTFTFEKSNLKLMGHYLIVRYVVALVFGLACYLLLPFNEMVRVTIVLGVLLPASVSVLTYSVEFKYDKRFVGTLSNLTMVISFLLLWGAANFLL